MHAFLLDNNKHSIFEAIIVFIWMLRLYIQKTFCIRRKKRERESEIEQLYTNIYVYLLCICTQHERSRSFYILYEWKLIVLYEPLMVAVAD